MDQISECVEEAWHGDVLERQPYAEFLTNYLVSKIRGRGEKGAKSFTLALDAQWGQGKTFFVNNWIKDLNQSKSAYPTLLFDAWSADYANDPLVAFMAAFKAALDDRIDAAGLNAPLKKKATEHVVAAVNGFRRAIFPAGRQIAKSLLQKTTGIAIEELYEAYKNEADTAAVDDEKVAKAGLDVVNKGLDEFFGKVLEAQGERQQAIQEFRAAIEDTLQELVDHEVIALPMFVFIDELDRCRPSFAIALLEGIKHLFGIPGVCFVVSTNMTQLSESIKAVYGNGFDGYGYLKRFFDVEYSLPAISNNRYIQLLMAEYPEWGKHTLSLGLPQNGFVGVCEPMDACYVLAWVSEVFGLDLRSQRIVVEMVFAAASGVPKGKKIFLLWLAVLCAIKHSCPDAFESLAVGRKSADVFKHAWDQATVADTDRIISVRKSHGYSSQDIKLRDVVWHYYEIMHLDLKDPRYDAIGENAYAYPQSVVRSVAEEMPSSYSSSEAHLPSIGLYFQLVRTAGHLVAF